MTSLRIAQVAPPLERVPPVAYGGTERVVHELVVELVRRGHHVTTFASGDSEVPGAHVVTVPRALRPAGVTEGGLAWTVATAMAVLGRAADFDVIHSHLDILSPLLAAASPVPVVATFHGRIDHPAVGEALAGGHGHYVAISRHQASTRPDVAWADVIHHGLTLRDAPFERRRGEGLVFVGRVSPEKGVVDAIQIALRAGRPLRIIAKVGPHPHEQAYFADVVRPALAAAGSTVEFMGELEGRARDEIVAASWATLMPGAWPEPFGLVAIESLACGTPVLARRVGALPEVIREGVDGFFGDDVEHLGNLVERIGELDRRAIRRGALERFNAGRMTDRYEALYRRVAFRGTTIPIAETGTGAAGDPPAVGAATATGISRVAGGRSGGLVAIPIEAPARRERGGGPG